LEALSNKSDFLYTGTDVAIWSICETGLAMVASAAATLRPLLCAFLSRSRLLGGSSQGTSTLFLSSRAGYLHSGGNSGRYKVGEIGLRSGAGKSTGVETAISGQPKFKSNSKTGPLGSASAEITSKSSLRAGRIQPITV
jgi:hypothetical protein